MSVWWSRGTKLTNSVRFYCKLLAFLKQRENYSWISRGGIIETGSYSHHK